MYLGLWPQPASIFTYSNFTILLIFANYFNKVTVLLGRVQNLNREVKITLHSEKWDLFLQICIK